MLACHIKNKLNTIIKLISGEQGQWMSVFIISFMT